MTYQDRVHRMGRLTAAIALILLFMPPLIISIHYQIFPPISKMLVGIATVCAVYLPIAVAEFLTYTPMLGSSASYLVFVTGNLSNLKIPCALTCIENAGVKPQTEEAEIVATIAVAVSSLVTVAILVVGMLAMVPLRPVLENPILAPAFEQILPALFGALGGYWILKQWKLAFVPILVVVILFFLLPFLIGYAGALIPVMGGISVIAARIMYKHQFISSMEG